MIWDVEVAGYILGVTPWVVGYFLVIKLMIHWKIRPRPGAIFLVFGHHLFFKSFWWLLGDVVFSFWVIFDTWIAKMVGTS